MKFKRPRATFSAPTPPLPPPTDDVVENDVPPTSETYSTTTPTTEESPTTEPVNAPTPPVKVVSRSQTKDTTASISTVLEETVPEEEKSVSEPPSTPEVETAPATEPDQDIIIDSNNDPKNAEKSTSNFLLIMITVFALVLGLAGWLLYFNASGTLNLAFISTSPNVTPTPAPTSAPSPTPNPRATVSLEVLNGSGVSGAAGATGDDLAKLGYHIVTVGNAANQKYTESEVYTGENLGPDAEFLLIDDLKELYGSATVSGVLASESSTASARIIVGKDWQE